MRFVGDFDIWHEYTKGMQRLSCCNVATIQHQSRPRVREPDAVEVFLARSKPRQKLEVLALSRAEIKKFEAQRSLDLHGCTREIDRILEKFCAKCILNSTYEVAVVTGKGQGVVRSATEFWLKSHPEFVVGFFEIRDSRGESGAFGVRLRKK